jgi:hypothetical protein
MHLVHLLSISKKKNKEKINVKKTTFYNFDILNTRITKKKNSFLINLTSAPSALFNIFLFLFKFKLDSRLHMSFCQSRLNTK